MTDQEILDEITDQIKNTSVAAKVLRWANAYALKLGGRYVFPSLRKQSSFATVVGTQSYTLASDYYFLRLMWTALRKLGPGDELEIASKDFLWNTQQGVVNKYILFGNTVLLYQLPASIETVYYSYQARPAILVSSKTSEYAGFPVEWHPVVAQGAIVRGLKYTGNPDYPNAFIELKDMIAELKPTLIRRLDYQHVLGTNEYPSGRMAAATLDPSHFPRN